MRLGLILHPFGISKTNLSRPPPRKRLKKWHLKNGGIEAIDPWKKGDSYWKAHLIFRFQLFVFHWSWETHGIISSPSPRQISPAHGWYKTPLGVEQNENRKIIRFWINQPFIDMCWQPFSKRDHKFNVAAWISWFGRKIWKAAPLTKPLWKKRKSWSWSHTLDMTIPSLPPSQIFTHFRANQTKSPGDLWKDLPEAGLRWSWKVRKIGSESWRLLVYLPSWTTNISPQKKALLKMMFFFPRWDMW